jgi:hypothetical protein
MISVRNAICAIVLSLSAGILSPGLAQVRPYAQYGSGVATKYAYFDPSAQLPPNRTPGTSNYTVVTLPRPTVLPTSEYQLRKSIPVPPAQGGAPSIVARTPSGAAAPNPRLPLALAPTISMDGLGQTNYTPPSPAIAAGPEDVLQVVNSAIAHYSRSGELLGTADLKQWFAIFLPTICSSGVCTLGDVTITYDQMHGRFILMLQAADMTARTSYLLLSVSNAATYAGGWKNWALDETLDGSTASTNWGDFPQPGLDPVAFYATTLQFSFSAGTYRYSKVRIFKKTDLYNTALTQLPYHDIFNLMNEDNTPASTLQVPHLRGRTEVATSTGYIINSSDVDQADYYTLWTINNPASDSPTVTRTTVPNAWKYGYPASAPQLGSAVLLDTGPSSISNAVMRDGLIYFALNTGYTDQPVTVTYGIVDAVSKKLTFQQRFVNGNFFYPAFDVPASVGPGNVLPNNLVVGTTTSAAGALTYAGINNIVAGQSPYTLSGSPARWGDFFRASVDPLNGGLWASGEYAKGTATWGTWNTYFPWATSQEFTDVDPTMPSFSFINVLKLWGITGGCTPTTYCPGQSVTRAQMAVFIIKSLYGNTFAYADTPYFTDVPANDPYFPYIQKLKETGITSGCTTTQFCPTDPITRWQGAVFVVKAKMAKLFGDNFGFPATAYFTDVPSSDPSFPFVQKLRELGYTTGCGTGTFCPSAPLTREAMAVYLVRAFLN